MITNQSLKKGRAAEHILISNFLLWDFEVYVPVTDVKGVDIMLKNERGTYLELQVKGRIVWNVNATFIIREFPIKKNFFIVCYNFRSKDYFIIPSKIVAERCKKIGRIKKWFVISYSFLLKYPSCKNERGIKRLHYV